MLLSRARVECPFSIPSPFFSSLSSYINHIFRGCENVTIECELLTLCSSSHVYLYFSHPVSGVFLLRFLFDNLLYLDIIVSCESKWLLTFPYFNCFPFPQSRYVPYILLLYTVTEFILGYWISNFSFSTCLFTKRFYGLDAILYQHTISRNYVSTS